MYVMHQIWVIDPDPVGKGHRKQIYELLSIQYGRQSTVLTSRHIFLNAVRPKPVDIPYSCDAEKGERACTVETDRLGLHSKGGRGNHYLCGSSQCTKILRLLFFLCIDFHANHCKLCKSL